MAQCVVQVFLLLLLLRMMTKRRQRMADHCSGRDGSDGPSRIAEDQKIAIMGGLTAAAPSSLLLVAVSGAAGVRPTL